MYQKIEMKKLCEIRPYHNNPRENATAISALVKIIPKIGFNVPIVIDKQGVIIKGHARYHAAKILGLEEVPCIVSDNSDEQNRIDRIYDNAISELSSWQPESLAIELREIGDFHIPEVKFDIPKVGYDEIALDINAGEQADKAKSPLSATKKSMVELTCPQCGYSYLIDKNKAMEIFKQNSMW